MKNKKEVLLIRLFATSLLLGFVALVPSLIFGSEQQGDYDVMAFGAKGDGKTLDTAAIQSAIDKATQAGGGRVTLPPGAYLSGSLHLKSHVELHLEQGATLLGSTSRSDYGTAYYDKVKRYALLLADGQEDVAISGQGTIDGQGRTLALNILQQIKSGVITTRQRLENNPNEEERPSLILFVGCRKVKLTDITLLASSCWTEIYYNCQDLVFEGIHVHSFVFWNNDGIDLVDCKHAQVSHCDFYSEDDGICLKSEKGGIGCDDIEINDCRVCSVMCNAFKLGTASAVGFHNIHANNITVDNSRRSAIDLDCVDGGVLDDVLIENVHGTNTGNAIFLRLGHRDINGDIGKLQDITIRNVSVEIAPYKPHNDPQDLDLPPINSTTNTSIHASIKRAKAPHQDVCSSSIVGLPGHPVQNVNLENIRITYPGAESNQRHGLTIDKLSSIPELPAQYPEFWMFGNLPAWGFYLRHAEGINFSNVCIVLQNSDYRPAFVMDDVKNVNADKLVINSAPYQPLFVLQDVQDASFDNMSLPIPGSEAIKTQGNCLKINVSQSQKVVESGNADAVKTGAN